MAVASAGRSRSPSWPSSSGARPRSPRCSPGGRPTATVLGYVPAGLDRCTASSASTCPATSAATSASSCRSSRASPTRRRSRPSSTRSSTSSSRTRPNGKQTYTADIKPWFGGELAFSVGPAARRRRARQGRPIGRSARPAALVLVSIKDQALAQAWFDAAIARPAPRRTTETYNGATLTVFEPSDGATAALAIVDGKVAARRGRRLGQGRRRHEGPASSPPSPVQGRARLGRRRPRRLRLRRAPPVARLVERR